MRVSRPGEFSVTTAGVILLGAIAAFALASAIALGGRRNGGAATDASGAASHAPPGGVVPFGPARQPRGDALPEVETEYPIDMSEPTPRRR